MLSHLLDSSLLPLALPAWPAVTRARAAPLDIEDHKDNYLLLVDVPGAQVANLMSRRLACCCNAALKHTLLWHTVGNAHWASACLGPMQQNCWPCHPAPEFK
jgi:hypothetical protein